MVNIAFPYREPDASAMELALNVLKAMAERGNKYMRACHSLLAKMRSTIRSRENAAGLESNDRQDGRLDQTEVDNMSTQSTLVAGLPQEQPSFNLDFEGDPGLWAEVLDSIDIDMDRQWVESALLRGQ